MRLVGKPGIQGDLGNSMALSELYPAVLDATIDLVFVRRHAVVFLERPDQIRCRKICRSANIFQPERARKVVVDVLGCAYQFMVCVFSGMAYGVEFSLCFRKKVDGSTMLLQVIRVFVIEYCVKPV